MASQVLDQLKALQNEFDALNVKKSTYLQDIQIYNKTLNGDESVYASPAYLKKMCGNYWDKTLAEVTNGINIHAIDANCYQWRKDYLDVVSAKTNIDNLMPGLDFEISEKQKEIENFKKDPVYTQAAKTQNTKTIIIVTAISLFILIGIITLSISYSRRNRNKRVEAAHA